MAHTTAPPFPDKQPTDLSLSSRQSLIKQLTLLFEEEFPLSSETRHGLLTLLHDVIDLYAGKWPSHEACQVGYHTIDHILEVTLAAARMALGWNRIKERDEQLPEQMLLNGMAAALFHDCGYIKEKNDHSGSGGKFTFSHVGRSRELARSYLTGRHWSAGDIDMVCRIIDLTEFNKEPDLSTFTTSDELVMAKMVASSDLVAQMADINYIPRLRDLHEEFLEAYESEGRTNLRERSVHIYDNLHEIVDNAPEFYEKFVLPRLNAFDRMDHYLVVYFADGRNPYLENIIANVSGQLLRHRIQWRRLGDILLQLGLVRQDLIDEALSRQNSGESPDENRHDPEKLSLRLLDWLKSPSRNTTRLGEILMEMKAVDAGTLRTGLLSQLLPEPLTDNLEEQELLYLLSLSLLAQNLYDDPWVFGEIIKVTEDLLQCECGSLLLVDSDKSRLHIVLHSGPQQRRLEGKSLALDKGLSGWVFRHGRAAYVTGASLDDFFSAGTYHNDMEIDNIIAVPLHVQGETIGVLEMLNKRRHPFGDHDADLLTLVANIMASSLALINKLNLKFMQR